MANLEIHLQNCLCESRGFKIARSSHRKCSIKKVSLKKLQNWQEITCDGVSFLITFLTFLNNVYFKISDTGFFLSVLRNFWEHLFYTVLQGDCFQIDLMVKKFKYVSLIFLNLQLNHAPLECSLLFWCNEGHLLMTKMSRVISGTAIIFEWSHRERFLQNLCCIGSRPTGKQRHVFWNV